MNCDSLVNANVNSMLIEAHLREMTDIQPLFGKGIEKVACFLDCQS